MRNFIILVAFLSLISCNQKSPIDPPMTNGLERFLLTEAEMPGYELKRQEPFEWIIAESNQMHPVIQQKWHANGRDERHNIFIEYCEFATEAEAIRSTAYAAQTFATPSIWGSQTGSIIGDNSWVSIDRGGIFFVRANVGIKTNLWVNFDENDLHLLLSLSSKLLDKIEPNLSPEMLAFEAAARQKQISLADYQKITESVVNSELMNGYSLHTTWDSKWRIESDSIVMGIRKEWKNEQGFLVGIDICKFDSDSITAKAATTQSRMTYSSVFNLDNLDSLKSILSEWQNTWQFGLPKNLFSVVAIRGNIAVHVYQFDPMEIDTNFFFSIVEKLSMYISNH